MQVFGISNWRQFLAQDDLGCLSTAEWVVYWVLVLTPLWWLLGIQTLFYPAVIWGLLLLNCRPEKLLRGYLPPAAWAWMGMVLVAAAAAFAGLAQIGFPLLRVAATGVTLFKGYGMMMAAIMLPFWVRLRLRVVTRAVCWLSFGYIWAIALLFLLLFLGIWTEPLYPPLARMIPGDKLSLLLSPAGFQEFFGITLPRTAIYTPDPPIPGVIGILSLFICLGESHRGVRWLGCCGCLVSLVVSQSRLAWITFPVVLLVWLCFRSMPARQGSLWSAALTNAFCAMLGISVADLLSQAKAVFTSARAASSSDRALVVGRTLEAWLEKPVFGWGIAMDSVRWYIYDIVLGSFSTYASVLYLQGLVGFGMFLITLGTTLYNCWLGAKRGDATCQRAFAAVLALCLLIEGLPLSWMSVYFWFFFLWLGGVFNERVPRRSRPASWHQLMAMQYESLGA